LVKWYLDCVTASGEVAILYSAVVHWRAIGISYCSYLNVDDARNESRSTMHAAEIHADGQRLLIDSPELKLNGEWTATAQEVKQTVFETEAGSVVWDCVQPGSQVRVRVGERELTGTGYAEVLSLSLPPWQLPLKHLRWGRFVTDRDTVAWIDWQGPHSLRLAFDNGERCTPFAVSDSVVSMGTSELRMSEPLRLRAGRLGQTVVPAARGLAKLFPKLMFNIEERKWRSRGTFVTPQGESHGWVIHEAVDWNL
jgi:hypothetical protein